MRFHVAYAMSCLSVVPSCFRLPLAQARPDPVHHRDIKSEARKQQRNHAKRLARARKGV
jgi:hypothetical protein